MRVLIFANPIAGRGRGKKIAQALDARLAQMGAEARTFLDPVGQIDLAEVRRPAQAAIAVGGDGTLRGVAELLAKHFRPEEIPPLLVVPLGTANLMRQHLGIDWHGKNFENNVAAAVQRRRVVHLDAGLANGKLFLLMAGVGMDAAIVHELDRVRSGPIDLLSYALPAAMTLKDYDYPSMSVQVDGERVFASAPAMAFVANIAEYGTGFPIAPHAKTDDGLLDVCVLPCRTRREALELILRTAAAEHLQVEGVIYRKGKRIRIDTDVPVPVQLDGDPGGHTPLEIELLPYRLPFIVP